MKPGPGPRSARCAAIWFLALGMMTLLGWCCGPAMAAVTTTATTRSAAPTSAATSVPTTVASTVPRTVATTLPTTAVPTTAVPTTVATTVPAATTTEPATTSTTTPTSTSTTSGKVIIRVRRGFVVGAAAGKGLSEDQQATGSTQSAWIVAVILAAILVGIGIAWVLRRRHPQGSTAGGPSGPATGPPQGPTATS
jgi:LPXTG-motif cell wall-anchored protein